MNTRIIEDARQLSSGTLAGLLGDNRYSLIDEAQRNFVAFVSHSDTAFPDWPAAWEAFRQSPLFLVGKPQ